MAHEPDTGEQHKVFTPRAELPRPKEEERIKETATR